MSRAYLVMCHELVDGEPQFRGVRIYSEGANSLTRMGVNEVYSDLISMSGDTYQEAQDAMISYLGKQGSYLGWTLPFVLGRREAKSIFVKNIVGVHTIYKMDNEIPVIIVEKRILRTGEYLIDGALTISYCEIGENSCVHPLIKRKVDAKDFEKVFKKTNVTINVRESSNYVASQNAFNIKDSWE